MKTLGFVQAFGRGIATARKVMAQNGNPEPTFEVDLHNILFTLRKRT